MADAVVIGAGPNGLVAANMLVDAGWEVVVCEEQAEPGGAVRSGEVTEPGFVHDLYSAYYPLTPASRYIEPLDLGSYGLRWRRAQGVVAHPHPDGRCALLSTDLEETCASLDSFAPGDGDAWRELFDLWRKVGPALMGLLLTPLPPIRPLGALLRALGPTGAIDFARFSLLPARRMADENFRGEGGGWLIAGNALHADLTPDSAGGGLFGWVLCGLGQSHGYPVAEGGAGNITEALVRRLRSKGGELHCGTPIERIELRGGRAVAAVTADGRRFAGERAILADCGAPALFGKMLPAGAGRTGTAELPIRQLDDQGQLGTARADPVDGDGGPAGEHDPRRRGDGRAGAGDDGARRPQDPRPPVPRPRPVLDGRSDPLARGDRDRLGLHPRPPGREGGRRERAHRRLARRRPGRALRRPDGGGGRATRARLPQADHQS